jgi:hypothetical protein
MDNFVIHHTALLPENYKPAPRETKADLEGTVATLDRRLKDRVYLMIGDSFPTTDVSMEGSDNEDGESLLEAALRGLQEQASKGEKKKKNKDDGSNLPLDLYCPSQAPLAVKLNPYESHEQKSTGFYGTKTFFVKVQYDDGVLGKDIDFAWLDRSEIVERIQAISGDDEAKFYRYML